LHNGCTEISWAPPLPPTRAVIKSLHITTKPRCWHPKSLVESSLSQKIPGNEEVICYNPTPEKINLHKWKVVLKERIVVTQKLHKPKEGKKERKKEWMFCKQKKCTSKLN
jgi:hypothetical protein